jgi:hypothetical protein
MTAFDHARQIFGDINVPLMDRIKAAGAVIGAKTAPEAVITSAVSFLEAVASREKIGTRYRTAAIRVLAKRRPTDPAEGFAERLAAARTGARTC